MIEARESASKQNHGRGFGPIAVKYSEDQVTRYKGGDIGWVNKNRPIVGIKNS
jgi:PPIC-type PPIASE domain.